MKCTIMHDRRRWSQWVLSKTNPIKAIANAPKTFAVSRKCGFGDHERDRG
jgi:hypothetical protein